MNLDKTTMCSLLPYQDFKQASLQVLKILHQTVGFNLWMVNEIIGNDCAVLSVVGQNDHFQPGDILKWHYPTKDELTQLDHPAIYPKSPIFSQLKLRAFVGLPIIREDGLLLGILSAFGFDDQEVDLSKHLDLITHQTRFLSTIAQNKNEVNQLQSDLKTVSIAANFDYLTEVLNQRGWEISLEVQHNNCSENALACSVIIIDIDDLKQTNDLDGHAAGNELLKKTARVLKKSLRKKDLIARIGGDEFALLLQDTDLEHAQQLGQSIRKDLKQYQIKASIGIASTNRESDVYQACHIADKQMYLDKRRRKQQPTDDPNDSVVTKLFR